MLEKIGNRAISAMACLSEKQTIFINDILALQLPEREIKRTSGIIRFELLDRPKKLATNVKPSL
jgi:hypothetical protein